MDSNYELTDLGDFPVLQSIGRDFYVGGNDSLTDVGDFPVLQTIGGNFNVRYNSNLTDLGDFPVLQSIGGNFSVVRMEKLTNLGDFPVLKTIGGSFYVDSNYELTDLGDFPVLQSIGVYFSVRSNDQLLTLGDFPALTSIGIGNLTVPSLGRYTRNVSIVVEFNNKLVLCSWVEKFIPTGTHAVIGEIYINNNATGCNSTEEINDSPPVLLAENRIFSHKDSTTTSFNVYANVRWQLATSDDATWITSLSSDSSTHSSRITGENESTITLIHTRAPDETPRSTTLTLTAINEEGNELTNPATVTINFTQLSTFYDGNITLSSQEEVDEFISNTTVILGNLTIGYTDFISRSNITNLAPLHNITHITGNLNIRQNEQLANLNDLNNLQTIGGYFNVRSNSKLSTLGDFTNLQTIGGYFNVRSNSKLSTLGDFTNLQTIGGYFNVRSNSKLSTLGDFTTLMSIGIGKTYVPSLGKDTTNVSIVVESNFRLSDCYTLTDFLPGGAHAISGGIYINNNAIDGDCNSQNGIINSIYTGDITVTTQAQVDALRDTLAGKTRIEGTLTIGYTSGSSRSNITDLTPLSNMSRITGNLTIQQNRQLVNLNDLNDLQSIGGYFGVLSNDSLTTLGNFLSLTSVGTGNTNRGSNVSIQVESNFRLSDCYTLTDFLPGGAHAVSGEIYINDNATDGGCNSRDQIKVTYRGDITATTQAEVNALNTTLAGKTIINGNLTIGYTGYSSSRSNITDLTPLRNMSHITGNLRIERNRSLDSLTDLNTLQSIGGYFRVSGNLDLTDLGDFPVLDSIGGYFDVSGNSALTDLGDFPVLDSIGGDFRVWSNSELTDLGDFPVLQSIGGYFRVSYNRELTDLGDFSSLQSIGGYFRVFFNDKLTTLGNFPALQTIGGDFVVDSVQQLISLGDFPVLQSIGGSFYVGGNTELTDLGDFPVLRSIEGSFYVGGNTELTDLGDFPVLDSIEGYFDVRDNRDLTDLGDFPVLQSIGGYFRVWNNNDLTDLGDFSSLQSIGGYFRVSGNLDLTDLGDFPVLDSIGGYFDVRDNRDLTDLGDFPVLQTIGGYFRVSYNRDLTDLGDFPVLQTIGGYFYVSGNSKLTTLGNFSSLTSIRVGSVNVPSERRNINNVSIVVENNSSLSDCYTLVEFLPGGATAVSGEISINNNALGCSSGGEIMASAPHTIMLTSHTEGDSIAIAYDEVTTQTIMFSIGGGATGWTSDITVDDFITLDTAMNVADTGVVITVRATPTKNTGVERSAVITFTTTGGTGATASATVTITQRALPTLVISTSDQTINHNAGDFTITFDLGGGAIGWESSVTGAGFITLDPSMNTTSTQETVTITATPGLNDGLERKDTIIFTTTGDIADTVVITQRAAPPTLVISTSDQTINHNAGDFTITFDLGGGATGWESSVTGAGFITLDPSMNTTSTQETVTITATPGLNDGLERKDTIIFTTTGDIADTVVITQRAAPPTLVISTSDQTINHNAGDFTITFDLGGGAIGWESSVTGAGFITLDPSMNTTSTQETVTITATPGLNDGLERKDTIIFTTTGDIADTVVITQRAAPPTLVISTSDQTINHNAGDFTITFDLGGGAIGWESSVTGAGFITLDPSMNTTSRQETVTITATPGLNDGLERKDTIIFTTTGGIADTVVITQRDAPPTLSLTSDIANTIAYDATDDIDIMFNVGGGATGWTSKITYTPVDANFITRSSSEGTYQTGAVTITATPEVNTGIDERTAIITLTTTGIGTPATQMIVIRQESKTLMVTTNKNHQIAYDNIDPISISFTVGGSATGWTSEITYTPVDANFITRSSSEGTYQTGAVTITATPTVNTGVERTATITLTTTGIGTPATQMIVIRQGANITISRETLIVTTNKNHQIAYNSTNPIPITFTVGGSATGWTSAITYAPADANFITRSSSEGTNQTGTITLMATPTVNTGVERTATITLTTTGIGTPATQMIVIRQGEANITISRETLIVTTNKNHQISYDNIDPISITFTVGGSATGWTSAITYMPADANFIALSPTRGTDITGAITLMATPTVNTGVERTATITLTTTGIGTSATQMIVIRQGEANTDTMTLPPADTMTLSTYTKEPFFALYPNPTESTLTIKGVTGYLQIFIHDLVGTEVMTYSLTPSKKTIDVSDLPSGMYVVTLQGEEQIWTEVLIIVN